MPDTFAQALDESWTTPIANPMGVEWFGLVMGLGFVLSFGYWCTDFLVVQRAMAADSMSAARRTPLIAAVPKMLFPFLVILPGMIAMALTQQPTPGTTPLLQGWPTARYNYNMALPLMLPRYFPAGMLGLGLTALMASFMSGMAGNVTAFNTVWTYDIYSLHPTRRERRALSLDGPDGDDLRHRRQHRDRLRCDALQQHHGHAAAGVRIRERAALCDVSARHVLEADHRARRVLGSGVRHGALPPYTTSLPA